jgi:site-specific recombinase XerD
MDECATRMHRDLVIRGYRESTIYVYLQTLKRFTRWFGRSPEEATLDDVNRYQFELARGETRSFGAFNLDVCALRFFFKITLLRDWPIERIPYYRRGRTLPVVLSPEEVKALFAHAPNPKYRLMLMTIYGTGLRPREVTHLRLEDIDRSRKVIRVKEGKRCRDRYVMLPRELELDLREYEKVYQPKTWLFPRRDQDHPISERTLWAVTQRAAKKAGIRKSVNPRALRHTFATHLLERGASLCVIQLLLGHSDISTTARYLQVANTYLNETPSPLDTLSGGRKAKKEASRSPDPLRTLGEEHAEPLYQPAKPDITLAAGLPFTGSRVYWNQRRWHGKR